MSYLSDTNLWATNLPAIMKGCKLLLKPLSEKSGSPQGVFFLLISAGTKISPILKLVSKYGFCFCNKNVYIIKLTG